MSDTQSSSVLASSVSMAKLAIDDGYCLLAQFFNSAFELHQIALKLPLASPQPNITWAFCRLRLRNALIAIRPHCLELPMDEDLFPWVVGYVGGQTREFSERAGGIRLVANSEQNWDTPEKIERVVGVKKSFGWNEDTWRRAVSEPMANERNIWLTWLNSVDAMTTASVDQPLSLLIEDELKGQQHKIFSAMSNSRKRWWSYDEIGEIQGAFREATDGAIYGALKRLQGTLNDMPEGGHTITVDAKNRRSELLKPPTNKGAK